MGITLAIRASLRRRQRASLWRSRPGRGPYLWRFTVRSHFAGRADGSTLRLTLGCLLADQLGIRLGLSPSGRFTFHEGEAVLSDWMAENAFVAWLATPSPWAIEEVAIRELDLPLNLDQNRSHVFHPTLSAVRRAAKVQARLRS